MAAPHGFYPEWITVPPDYPAPPVFPPAPPPHRPAMSFSHDSGPLVPRMPPSGGNLYSFYGSQPWPSGPYHSATPMPAPLPATVTPATATASAAPTKRKSSGDKDPATSAKRKKSSGPVLSAPCGVGPPITAPSPTEDRIGAQPPEFLGAALPSDNKTESAAAATDVWYFMRQRDGPTRPQESTPDKVLHMRRPESDYVSCRLCDGESNWSCWKLTNHAGIATTIRAHLSSKHSELWSAMVVTQKLKGWEKCSLGRGTGGSDAADVNLEAIPNFTLDGFLSRLTRWVVVDDQSFNVVEGPEFCDLLAYIGAAAGLHSDSIPHRIKLKEIIEEYAKKSCKLMLEDLKGSEGRVSFTTDLWSDIILHSFMAVTAHYCAFNDDGHLVLRHRLIAFRHVLGEHTGENLAAIFLAVLQDAGVTNKIGEITMDNASNCNTMMEHLALRLRRLGIPFDKDGNRIRCFPHVINIAVTAGIESLTVTTPEFSAKYPRYAKILEENIIAKARAVVTACRTSGQRRADFRATIEDGNKHGTFKDTLRLLQLLRDVNTRWSSLYLMIERLLYLYPAVGCFLDQSKQRSIAGIALDSDQLRVLRDIQTFLQVLHTVQELLSAQNTPTLAFVMPLYESLIDMLKALRAKLPGLAPAIMATVSKLEEYVLNSRKSRIYALATILHPVSKLQWISEHWTPDEHKDARKWICDAMMEYQKISPARTPAIAQPSCAARAQASGLARLDELAAIINSQGGSPGSGADSNTNKPAPTEHETQAANLRTVEEELRRYETEGTLTSDERKAFDLVRYWDTNRFKFPLLFRVALDVLPAQASAVPCERVFSSSKETITPRRNSLDAETTEILQVLKFIYRQDRLVFTERMASEEELLRLEALLDQVAHIDRAKAADLLVSEEIYALGALFGK